MKASCSRCGIELDRIAYLEPDWEGHHKGLEGRRPPLCEVCWRKADEEARKHYARRPT